MSSKFKRKKRFIAVSFYVRGFWSTFFWEENGENSAINKEFWKIIKNGKHLAKNEEKSCWTCVKLIYSCISQKFREKYTGVNQFHEFFLASDLYFVHLI